MIDTFLNNILWLRKHYGLSKKEMARKLQIGIWTLNKIEKGELPPRLSIDIVFSIYKNFGIRSWDLISRRLGGNDTGNESLPCAKGGGQVIIRSATPKIK